MLHLKIISEFHYLKNKDQNKEYIICYSSSNINPFSLLLDLSKKIESITQINHPITILFDLYNTNGNSSNRFAKIDFNNGAFIRDSFQIICASELNPKLLDILNSIWIDFSNLD